MNTMRDNVLTVPAVTGMVPFMLFLHDITAALSHMNKTPEGVRVVDFMTAKISRTTFFEVTLTDSRPGQPEHPKQLASFDSCDPGDVWFGPYGERHMAHPPATPLQKAFMERWSALCEGCLDPMTPAPTEQYVNPLRFDTKGT